MHRFALVRHELLEINMGWYTIEYLDGAQPIVSPMLFRDRASALASACALLEAGFSVSKVTGPEFEMSRTALKAYHHARELRQAIRHRPQGRRLLPIIGASGQGTLAYRREK